MINSQEKDNMSTQPFSTSSMDLFASQGPDIQQRKRQKRSEIWSLYDVYIDVAEDPVSECLSESDQSKGEPKQCMLEEFDKSEVSECLSESEQSKGEPKQCMLEEFDKSEVHADSSQEQRQKEKKKRDRSKDLDICDTRISRDLSYSMLQVSSDSNMQINIAEDLLDCKERNEKYKLRGLDKSEICADNEQEQSHGVKRKKKNRSSKDNDIDDMSASGDWNKQEVGLPEKNMKGLSEAEDSVDAVFKSKETKKQQKKYTLQDLDESEVCAASDQEQSHGVKRKKKNHSSKDNDIDDMSASGDWNKQEVGLPEKNMKGLSEAEDSVDAVFKSKETKKQQKKYTLQDLDESEVCAASDQEQSHGVKRKKKNHSSKDNDIDDMLVSRDWNKQEVGLPEKNMKGLSEAEDSVDAVFKSKETKKQQKKYTLQDLDESEVCAASDQEQSHGVKRKKKNHSSKDNDIDDMSASGDWNKQEVGLPEKNMKGLSEAEDSVDAVFKSKETKKQQKKYTLQDLDESEVCAASDQEQSHGVKRKKKNRSSKDNDIDDMSASGDWNKQEVGLPEKNMKGLSEAEDSVDAVFKSKETKKQQKKYTLQDLDESEVCAASDQEQRHAGKKKKKKHRSKDNDIDDMSASGDWNKQEVGLPEKNMKALSEASVDALLFKSKETKKRHKKYKLHDLDESERCVHGDQEQRHAVKKKKRKHKAKDVNVSGDLDDQEEGAAVYLSRNKIYTYDKKGHHTGVESKCASDALNGDANTITLRECSSSGKDKKKKRQLESGEVNILSVKKSHSKYQASYEEHTSQCDKQCLTDNNEEMHRSEQIDPLSVCQCLEMTNNKQLAKCGKKKKRILNKHAEEIIFLNERQDFNNRKCYLCEMSVAGKDNYIKHLAAAHNRNVFQCSRCGRCCTSREGLSLHQSTACDQEMLFPARIYKCNACPMSYKNYRSLWRHNVEQHKIGHTVGQHVCQRCNKSFTRRASVQIHLLTCMKRKENSGEGEQGEIPCKVCQKVFSSSRSLRYHISTIHEQRQFACSTCGEVFRWSKGLSKHREKHHE